MDYLIYLPNALPKEFGAVIILKGGVTVSQTATASQGAPGRGGGAQMRVIYFPINKDSVLGAVLWEVFIKAQNMLFCLFVFRQFFVTTVQVEKARNR